MEKGQPSIGAIWKTKSKAGAEYFSVQIELEGKKYKIVAFPNKFKENEKHPDYKMYLSEPLASSPATRPAPQAAVEVVEEVEVEGSDDIPF